MKAKEFDEKFEKGEDISKYLDLSKARRPGLEQKRVNAVLVSENDWKAIQETMYLLSIPGMRESIVEGLKTPADKLSKDPKW